MNKINSSKLYNIATDYNQYDSQDIKWKNEIGLSSPIRKFFWDFIEPYSKNWKDKKVLDVGAGTGWMLRLLQDKDCKVMGVEPSKKNVKICKKINPDIQMILSSVEEFETNDKFDEVLAVMVMTHIKDVVDVFTKINKLLSSSGEVFIIIPDYDYYKRPRYGYDVEVEELNKNEYIISVNRPAVGKIVDVVRDIKFYKEAGEKAGLKLIEDIGMKPTKDLIEKIPKYKKNKDTVITHLLHFRKIYK